MPRRKHKHRGRSADTRESSLTAENLERLSAGAEIDAPDAPSVRTQAEAIAERSRGRSVEARGRPRDARSQSAKSDRSVKSAKSAKSVHSMRSAGSHSQYTTRTDGRSTFDLSERPRDELLKEMQISMEDFTFDLKDFLKVPLSMYKYLSCGSIIKYVTLDGQAWKGGIVRRYQIVSGKEMLQLGAKVTGGFSWNISLNNVRHLYKKINPAARIEIELMNNSIKNLQDEIKSLQEEVKRLNAS